MQEKVSRLKKYPIDNVDTQWFYREHQRRLTMRSNGDYDGDYQRHAKIISQHRRPLFPLVITRYIYDPSADL